jgi:hypothetical protein
MQRLVIVIVLAALSSLAANAAPPRKHKPHAAPPAPVTQPAIANRPSWAAPQQCFTNDGNGRFLPCDLGDGR